MGVRHHRIPIRLLALGVVVAGIVLIPLFFVVSAAVSVGWDGAYELIVRPRVGQLLENTTVLTAGTLAGCATIGTGAAWLVERTDLPGRRLWHVLLAAPLAIPAFVNSYAWIALRPSLHGLGGATLVVTLSYFPFVYLPVVAALRGLDPALEETARSLGHSPTRTFLRVVVPQLRPALLGGLLLVALHLLAEFGALQMMRFPTFTTAIFDQFQSTFSGDAANMLSGVLVVLCLVALVAELRFRGRQRLSRVGAGAARHAPKVVLGSRQPLAIGALVILLGLALVVPIYSLVRWLVIGSSAAVSFPDLAEVTVTSLRLGVVGAVVTVLMALPVAWMAVRYRSTVTTVIERSTYIGHSLPGIVIALALVSVSIDNVRSLYQTTPVLYVGYAILFIPLAMVSLRAAIEQAPPALDTAARSLGVGTAALVRRVTLPIIAPGLGTGFALVFLAIVTELTATLLLAPTGTHTLATEFWTNADSFAFGAAAPYAAVMVLLSLPATYLLTRESASERAS